jgi:phospholipid/cholesterol/gamma-HCH transport system substrate-binding protein
MSGKEMRVNLMYGGATAKDGDTLKGAFKLGTLGSLSSQVGPVKDQLQVVLHRVDSLMTNANMLVDAKTEQKSKLYYPILIKR